MSYDVHEAEKNNQNNNTLLSPMSIGMTQTPSILGTLERSDTLRKKLPSDRAYFINKEILMTERTYRRDLDVINLVGRFIFQVLDIFQPPSFSFSGSEK